MLLLYPLQTYLSVAILHHQPAAHVPFADQVAGRVSSWWLFHADHVCASTTAPPLSCQINLPAVPSERFLAMTSTAHLICHVVTILQTGIRHYRKKADTSGSDREFVGFPFVYSLSVAVLYNVCRYYRNDNERSSINRFYMNTSQRQHHLTNQNRPFSSTVV